MHPTRNLPSCATCAHYLTHQGGRCGHPDAPVDMVTGAACMPAAQMRSVVAAPSYAVVKTCGVEGRLHSPRQMPRMTWQQPEQCEPAVRPVAPPTPWSLTGALRNLRYRGQ